MRILFLFTVNKFKISLKKKVVSNKQKNHPVEEVKLPYPGFSIRVKIFRSSIANEIAKHVDRIKIVRFL